ncbi:NAC domain-containing protein 29 isoform 1 [Hibiscus syriacus]|uniref:NAC domain-containing protein 29 isoform 1 n=1 Tax=Hibiscus syriacus TaxID=106335 RepID=A0A6A2YJ98_HIBSY|nr:NAC domain-containing protein 29 isoform 1 [Hibiscus syriacus]
MEDYNALSLDFFAEFPRALHALDRNPNVSVVVLSGAGNHFCGGLDLKSLAAFINDSSGDHGRIGERLRRQIKFMQDAITAIERCRKPVIAAIHGECRGTGVGIVTACDVRYCTKDSFFSVKEVGVAIAADMGTLQRLPGIVGFGNAMELSKGGFRVRRPSNWVWFLWFSGQGRNLTKVFAPLQRVRIGRKPPLAVVGTKAVLIRSRDLNLEQGLEYVATWNSSMLLSDDLTRAISAQKHVRKPTYAKL